MTKLGKNGITHTALLLVFSGEVLAGYWLMTLSNIMKILGLGLHVILVILFAYLFKKIKVGNTQGNINFALVALILALVLPVYGMLGMSLLYLSMFMIKVKAVDYFEVDDSFLPEKYKFLIKDVDNNILAIKRDELNIDAFKDIFRSYDRQLEENAINKLSKLVNKHSVAILKEVIKNSSSDTKILAASALIEMEDKIIKKIEEFRNFLQDQPENTSAILELARTYDLYCYLGVLDSVIQKYYQKLALEQYRKFLEYQPNHLKANLEYGRILLNAGYVEEAIRTLKYAIGLTPQNPNPHIWLAEAYYELADYKSLTNVCHKLTEFEKLPENIKEIVHWWVNVEQFPQN
ncbi:MAG: tetratricopeptide repeat protein [bacterium]